MVRRCASRQSALHSTPSTRSCARRNGAPLSRTTTPEGIKGAEATALAVFLARFGATKDQIRTEIADRFQYDLSRTIEEIRPGYQWDVSCQACVPEAIVAFLDSRNVEHAIRLAISLGGDADTQAAIAGGIAHAYYKHVSDEIVHAVRERLPADFIQVIDAFDRAFPLRP